MANYHYEAIMLLNNSTDRHTEEEVTIESPCPNTLEQPLSLDDADDVIYLTYGSKTTTIQQLDSVQYNTSNNELQFPTHLFVNIAAKWVDDLPHDIGGLKLYKFKCSPREWVQKSQDLRDFKMHSPRRKDLIGRRKFGRCIRNLYCSYDDCLFKLSAEGKRNTSILPECGWVQDFLQLWNVANRQWCGSCKMTEYCRESESLTIYHIGMHKCLLKLDTNKYSKQVRDEVLRNSGLGTCVIQ